MQGRCMDSNNPHVFPAFLKRLHRAHPFKRTDTGKVLAAETQTRLKERDTRCPELWVLFLLP